MLPDSIFSKGIIWSVPLEFKLPEIYHGYMYRDTPQVVWDMWLYKTIDLSLGETKTYGIGGGDAAGNLTYAELHMLQYDVYGFVMIYDMLDEPIYLGRRIHLQGFFHEDLSRRTCNTEPFQALQGDFFEIAISLHDRRWQPVQANTLDLFEWRLWNEAGEVILAYTQDSPGLIFWHSQIRFRLSPDETADLLGRYTHEASCIIGDKRYSLFTGTAEFIPTRL